MHASVCVYILIYIYNTYKYILYPLSCACTLNPGQYEDYGLSVEASGYDMYVKAMQACVVSATLLSIIFSRVDSK
jgi:hypothetical protein